MDSVSTDGIDAFFNASSVAVFGSLDEWGGLGRGVLQNMAEFGYEGRVYPINPSRDEAMGRKVYRSVGEVGEAIDLAVVITPRPTVPGIVDECARNGIGAAIVISESFAEADGEGAKLQRRLVEIARRTGIRIMGPNTVGVLNVSNGLITVPYLLGYSSIRKGGIAYCSQTGIAAAQCQPLGDREIGISKMCDIGNKCDVNEVDMLDYLRDDPDTSVVAMHLEDVKDGRRFIESARKLTYRKPLVVLKPGRTEAAARASRSHTGSLTGNDACYDNAFKQVGAVRVSTWQEYWDVPKVFASSPLPEGNRVAVVTHSGGAGVAAADVASESGLTLCTFSPATADKLARISPRLRTNPLDLGPVLSTFDDPFAVQEEVCALVMDDPNVDCASFGIYAGILSPVQVLTDMFDRLKDRMSKPVTVHVYGPRLFSTAEMCRQLELRGLPTYFDSETAIRALGMAAGYAAYRREVEIA